MAKKEKDPTSTGGFTDWLLEIWERFNVFSTIKDEDTVPMMIGKVIVRIIGFIIILILSPFFLLGMFIAFAAVS